MKFQSQSFLFLTIVINVVASSPGGAGPSSRSNASQNLLRGLHRRRTTLDENLVTPTTTTINIFHEDGFALAVDDDDDCGELYEVTNVAFSSTNLYVPNIGFVEVATGESRFQWLFNQQTGIIESVHCPGKVLDITASNCDMGNVILYGEHSGPNQQWISQSVEGGLKSGSEFAGLKSGSEFATALESVLCTNQFIQLEFPVIVAPESQREFKSSAFTLRPISN